MQSRIQNLSHTRKSSSSSSSSTAEGERTLFTRVRTLLRRALLLPPRAQISPDASGTPSSSHTEIHVLQSPSNSASLSTHPSTEDLADKDHPTPTPVPVPVLPATPAAALTEAEWEDAAARVERLLRHASSSASASAPDSALARLLAEDLPYATLPLTAALRVLRRYHVLDANLLIVAWALLRRLLHLAPCVRSLQRLLFVCIVLAAKAHLDNTVNSAIFSRLGRVPPVWLARTEYAAWAALDMACFVSPAEYVAAAKDLALPW